MSLCSHAGETEEQHRELVAFCKRFKFERMGAFAYSEEDGTPAAEMPDQVWNGSLSRMAQGLKKCMGKLLAHLRRTACMALDLSISAQVPVEIRQARRDELISQQQLISQRFAEFLIGKEVSNLET